MIFNSSDVSIQRLNSNIDIKDFTCGVAEIDGFFHRCHTDCLTADDFRVQVAVSHGVVVGMYSLSTGFVQSGGDFEPAIMLNALAVEYDLQGSGLGSLILEDAIRRSASVAGTLAIRVLVANGFDSKGLGFILSHGFRRMPDASFLAFLPLSTDLKAF